MTDDTKPPAHYTRYIEGVLADPYAIADAYGLTDPRLFSALKKVLAAGTRGEKSQAQDVSEAINALRRWQDREEKRAGTRGFWGVFAGMEEAPGNEVVEPIADDDAPMSDAERAAAWRRDALLRHAEAQRLDDELVAARARIADLQHERQWLLDKLSSDAAEYRSQLKKSERERDEAREAMRKVIMELPSDVLQNDERTPADRVRALRESREQDRAKLSEGNKRYRERKQSEEPAPEGDIVLVRGRKGKRWISVLGEHVAPDAWWTYPPVVKGE